jgi:uncharacterized protein YcnI
MHLSVPRGGRSALRTTAVLVASAGLVGLALAAPASAHVTVHADNATRGASDAVLAFRVPNERSNATTTKLEVAFPTATPLLGVLVAPHPGWSFTVKTTTLNPPVKTDDGTISEAVSLVTWTADGPADAIPVGGYADFDVTAGTLPDTSSLTFKALQTYSSGEVVHWIEIPQAGQTEPDTPAPMLTLSSAGAGSGGTAPAASAVTTGKSSASDTTARILGGIGIGLAVVLGAGGYLLGRRRSSG